MINDLLGSNFIEANLNIIDFIEIKIVSLDIVVCRLNTHLTTELLNPQTLILLINDVVLKWIEADHRTIHKLPLVYFINWLCDGILCKLSARKAITNKETNSIMRIEA